MPKAVKILLCCFMFCTGILIGYSMGTYSAENTIKDSILFVILDNNPLVSIRMPILCKRDECGVKQSALELFLSKISTK